MTTVTTKDIHNNTNQLLIEAEQHISNNKFETAYSIYKSLLAKYTNSAEIYNNIAICAYQLKLHQEARAYIEQAIIISPDNPLYLIQKAHFLYSSEFQQAKELFNKAVTLTSDKKNIEQINYYYFKLLFKHACVLAKELVKTKQLEAIELFKECLEYNKTNYSAAYNIACCYFNLEDNENGVNFLKKTIELEPNHSQAHFGLSQYYQQTDSLEQAEKHLSQSLKCKSLNQANAEYNYGVLEQQRNNYNKAIAHYKNCLEINSDHFAACYNIASIYHKTKDFCKAIDYYKQAVNINPQDKTCKYLISALSQKFNSSLEATAATPAQAPSEYIENLFDNYAESFDQELISKLDYKTPEHLYNLYLTNTKIVQQFNLNILDLGCGTGLSGGIFKKHACILTGVDISQKMLDKAAGKKIYNNLIKQDIADYLEQNTYKYNIIILADVLVYYGDLKNLLHKISKNLIPGNNSFILFSIELLDNTNINNLNSNYILNLNGRYMHTQDYIKSVLNDNQLNIIKIEKKILRKQNQQDVAGLLIMANHNVFNAA